MFMRFISLQAAPGRQTRNVGGAGLARTQGKFTASKYNVFPDKLSIAFPRTHFQRDGKGFAACGLALAVRNASLAQA
jgi:hypothetical protein